MEDKVTKRFDEVVTFLKTLEGTFKMTEIKRKVSDDLGEYGESIVRRAVLQVAKKNGTRRMTTWTF